MCLRKLEDEGGAFALSLRPKDLHGVAVNGKAQVISLDAPGGIPKPEILIFDDSFSALDYQTDKKVRENLRTDCKGITSLVVAQRIGTIMDADLIIVLENGRAVGQGKHADLLKDCPVYREIALSQLTEEELGL